MNPFLTGVRGFGGKRLAASDVDSRLRMVKGFDVAQCAAALRMHSIQKTVRVACQRRLRKLNREQP